MGTDFVNEGYSPYPFPQELLPTPRPGPRSFLLGMFPTVGMVPGCVCGVPLVMSIEHGLTASHLSYDSRKTWILGYLFSVPMSPHVSFPCVVPLGMSLRG